MPASPLPLGRGQGEGAAVQDKVTDSDTAEEWNNAVTKRLAGKTAFARKLRVEETEEEYFLWSDLRGRRLNGYKFARQIPLGPYIADFLCRDARLIVELDGGQHSENNYDSARTKWLNQQGYSVIRFWNNEVRFERAAVLETILAVLEGRIFEARHDIRYSPGGAPSPCPLPEGRGGASRGSIAEPSPLDLSSASASPLPSGRGQGEGAAPVIVTRLRGAS
jgi:very-short-patch-repair endonuclease